MSSNWFRLALARVLADKESGGTAVEYAIIAALVAAVVAGAVVLIGPALVPSFQTAGNAL